MVDPQETFPDQVIVSISMPYKPLNPLFMQGSNPLKSFAYIHNHGLNKNILTNYFFRFGLRVFYLHNLSS